MLVWAHRGASKAAPENTLAAFELARRMRADGVELDVRLSGGGEVVVAHDPDLGRVAGVPLVIAETPLSELRRHDLGGGQRLPLLKEALQASGDLLVNVELKVESFARTGLEAVVARTVREAGVEHRVMFSCFHPAPLWRLRRLLPAVKRALLFGGEQSPLLRRGWHRAFAGLHAVNPEHVLVNRRRIARWHGAGLQVNVWTVDEPSRIRELSTMGADGVITDRPDSARDALMGLL